MSDTPTKVYPRPQQEAPRDEVLLGRYRVLERRGTGGFGTVCTCWDLRLQRRVAIKRLPVLAEQGTTTPEEALEEARRTCMLAHPNIVTVHDFESDGTYAYIVMEYVDGLNLAELLARVEGGTLTLDECAHMLSSVARALTYTHENLTLHLDIKPTNIMIDRQGTVKLADFGMSTLASAAGYGGARGGTVGYMPPEQIEGMLVDERTDVFSLAVVVLQALTGTDPFLARTAAESLQKINRGPGRLLSRSCPELSGEPERALTRALAAVASQRTPSVAEFAEALLPYLGDEREGEASLAELVGQAERDDGQSRTGPVPVPREGGQWALRLPQVEGLATRGLTALAAFVAVRLVLPSVPGVTDESLAVASLVAAGLSALWPPAGAPLVLAALVAALALTSPSLVGALIAAALAAATIWWWARVGRHEHPSSLAVLMPCCLPSPSAGAALAGFALDPADAALTGCFGYLVGTLVGLSSSVGLSAEALVGVLVTTVSDPSFWLGLMGAVSCAAVSSAVAMRGSVLSGVIGQSLGLACIIFFEVFAAGMENDNIWPALDWKAVALAVILFVFLCIATVLRGPLFGDQEGKDIDELSQ